jgi:hypothetical protein
MSFGSVSAQRQAGRQNATTGWPPHIYRKRAVRPPSALPPNTEDRRAVAELPRSGREDALESRATAAPNFAPQHALRIVLHRARRLVDRQDLMNRPRRTPRSLYAVLSLVLAAAPGCSGSNQPSPGAAMPGGAPPPAPTGAAAAQTPVVRALPVVPGRPARVFIFAGFGDHCEPVAAPEFTVTTQPAKGDVSFVPGQKTVIKTSAKGTCLGKTTTGTGIYYTAREGQQGSDRFAVLARLPSGDTTTRTFEVRIAQ